MESPGLHAGYFFGTPSYLQVAKNPKWNLQASTLAEFGTHQLELSKAQHSPSPPIVQVAKNPKWNLQASTLAEFGTHQLEFFKLSQKTGNDTYYLKAEATIRLLYDRNPGQVGGWCTALVAVLYIGGNHPAATRGRWVVIVFLVSRVSLRARGLPRVCCFMERVPEGASCEFCTQVSRPPAVFIRCSSFIVPSCWWHVVPTEDLLARCYLYGQGCSCVTSVQGLMPLFVNPKTGRWTNRKVSFGALGDSYYEYLIKLWVLKGRQPQDEWVREMWEQVSISS